MNDQPLLVLLVVIGTMLFWSSLDWPVAPALGQKPAGTQEPALAQKKVLVLPSLPPPAGGSFALVDHAGRKVTNEDFHGNYLLVYFGYTYCPDVCPTDLQMLSEAIDMLGNSGTRVQPVFITVDPERDTQEALADYVSAFHPRLVGLTGTPKQIKAVAKDYGVRYFKLYAAPVWDDEDDEDDEKNENAENDEEELDYAVSHTAFTYLLGPDGRGLATFPHGTWPQDMAPEIQRFIEDKTGG